MYSYITTILLLTISFIPLTLFADPWGKDADLCFRSITGKDKTQPTLLSQLGFKLICFHQKVISPTDGPRSHYIPSSSQYAFDAIRAQGFFKGYLMGCDRLMRENSDPWVYRTVSVRKDQQLKWDPVR